jgi:hypothetical protein
VFIACGSLAQVTTKFRCSVARVMGIAEAAAKHTSLSNYVMVTAISRINDMSATDGPFAESLMAGIVQSGPEVVAGLDDFLQKKSWRLEVADRSDVIDATRVHNCQVCIGVRWVRDIGKT